MTGSAAINGTSPGSRHIASDTDGLFALLVATSELLTVKYPKKHGAFERVVQLAEETGEVAEQINIWDAPVSSGENMGSSTLGTLLWN